MGFKFVIIITLGHWKSVIRNSGSTNRSCKRAFCKSSSLFFIILMCPSSFVGWQFHFKDFHSFGYANETFWQLLFRHHSFQQFLQLNAVGYSPHLKEHCSFISVLLSNQSILESNTLVDIIPSVSVISRMLSVSRPRRCSAAFVVD